MDQQRDARQRPDALFVQDRVEHVAVIDVIQDDRPPPGGDAARETPADRDLDALADFPRQAAGRGGDQLAARAVRQQHRGGIGIQDLPYPAQQRGEEVIGGQMRQRRIGHRLDIAQLVLRTWRRARRQFHDERVASPPSGGQLPYRHKPVYSPGLPAEEPGVLAAAAKPPDNGRQMWHIGPAYDQQPTVLADLPVPMDLRLQFGLQFSAVWGPSRKDRPTTPVQPEPIRMMAP